MLQSIAVETASIIQSTCFTHYGIWRFSDLKNARRLYLLFLYQTWSQRIIFWQVSRLKFLGIQALPGTSQLFSDTVCSTPLLDVATDRCVVAWHRSAWAQQFDIFRVGKQIPTALLFLRGPTFFAQTFSRSTILTERFVLRGAI